jgi:hypothetical protein
MEFDNPLNIAVELLNSIPGTHFDILHVTKRVRI